MDRANNVQGKGGNVSMFFFFLLRLTNGKPSTKVVDRRQICISVSKYLICRQNLTNAAFTCQALVGRETQSSFL